MYLVAILLPPLAILMTGRIFQAAFSLLVLPFYFPSALWAILVVADHKANRRADRTAEKIARRQQATVVTTNVQVNNTLNVHGTAGESSDLVQEMVRDQARAAVAAARRQDELASIERRQRSLAVVRGLAALPLAAKELPTVTLRAYRELPEWLQPVSWGLAAGTPCAVILAIVLAWR